MLKADLHIHTNHVQKKREGHYSPKEAINILSKKGYEVLALTEHASLHGCFIKKTYKDALNSYYHFKDYAKKKNVLLIPGVEKYVGGGEVLILNYRDFDKIKEFEDLEKVREENGLIVAPHPFYPMGLRKKLIENIKYFDAIEYSMYYLNHFNYFNNKAEKTAKKYNKPLLANSDGHWKFQLGRNYSLIDSNKNVDSVLEAIRKNKVKIKIEPLKFPEFVFLTGWTMQGKIRKLFSV
ncbi:MAG: PHP-associated domain-containing protein [Candidatus Nanoarchaeia archaeon]|nr:PHP-associated domain-containing protein [Candidatus Nanoarchaeia archaeon]